MAIRKVNNVFRNLPVTSVLNAFVVMEDEDKTQFVNVFRSFVINQSAKENSFIFEFYNVDGEEFLDDISSQFYGTPTLWWVIAEFNDVVNPFEALEEGEALRIINGNVLYTIFDELQFIGEL